MLGIFSNFGMKMDFMKMSGKSSIIVLKLFSENL